jgi:branched-subunit amino acid ABC-type transport system permease component
VIAAADIHAVSVVDGLAIGALVFILSLGLVLILGVMDILNLAHGALYLVGAYLAWKLTEHTSSWPRFLLAILLAAAVGLVGGALLAVMTEPLFHRGHLDQALLTVGVAILVTEGLTTLFGDESHAVDAPIDGRTTIFGSPYPTYRLAVLVFGLALAPVVYLLVERTQAGALVRATAADRAMVAVLGVDTRRVVVVVFALGSALAALAGVVGGPIYGASPGLGTTVLLTALAAAVIGGLRSVFGILIGSLIVGEVESVGPILLPHHSAFLLFGAMALVLIVRPHGLVVRRGG